MGLSCTALEICNIEACRPTSIVDFYGKRLLKPDSLRSSTHEHSFEFIAKHTIQFSESGSMPAYKHIVYIPAAIHLHQQPQTMSLVPTGVP
mmetsp:Transcript_22656/g.43292  ORF Transcript_22656/g.43292 Transcript_22656/m.43292 type:complete len:91 (-) Transcript_22656:822-1094(-)